MPDTPDFVDLGAGRCDEGFFLLRHCQDGPFPSPPAAHTGWRFSSTFRGSSPSLRDAVLDLIRGARRKVFVTSFILGDDELIDALASAARRLTGGVYVISGLNEQSLRKGLAALADRNEKITQKVEAEKKRFVSLTQQGIAVRGHENCHAKFVVVDDTIAWVGSANLETGAFTRVGEVGVVLDDPDSVTRLARLFARMWLADCKYELPAFTDSYQVTERLDIPPARFTVPDPIVGDVASVVWTDDVATSDDVTGALARSASLRLSLQDVIRRARRHVLLATFSLNRMSERPDLLLDHIEQAIGRGVRVDMFVRAMNGRDRHRHEAGVFHNLGVHILADDANHAKAAVADDNHGMLFSANFDADHGLEPGTGIEVGARLDGTPALTDLIRYLRHAMTCASRSYEHRPTARQLHDGLSSGPQPAWPHGDAIDVECDQRIWEEFAAAARQGPLIWTRAQAGPVELLAQNLQLRLRPDGSTLHLDLTARLDRPPAQDFSQFIRETHRSTAAGRERGICTALLRHTPDSGGH